MQIAVIGGGYVGLVSGACFANFGVNVSIVETNPKRFSMLERGEIPIYEPGLAALVSDNVAAGRLQFIDTMGAALAGVDIIFIAVGTPPRNGDGCADLAYVFAAAEEVARHMTGYAVVVTKSTVPVGTSRRISEIIRGVRPDLAFDVASNPEFLREGSAIGDFMRPDRVIIGLQSGGSDRARDLMKQLYRPLYLINAPILFTSLESAELTKYAANAFLAMKISFINEMADICEKVGGNIHELAHGIGLDGRIGRKFLHAGPGYGGSCFPKDTLALMRIAQEVGASSHLVEATVRVNDARKTSMAMRIMSACRGTVRDKTIAVLGLTFKPETDDMRDAASIPIIHRLVEAGARIQAFDPVGMSVAKPLLPFRNVEYCSDALAAIDNADALVVLTEWNQFRALSPDTIATRMRGDVVVDLRNIFDDAAMRLQGLNYSSIGRPDPALFDHGSIPLTV